MEFRLLILALFSVLMSTSNGAEILALFPIHGISNYNVAEALLKTLANRGHNVTVVTSFPQKKPVPNLYEIDVSGAKGLATNSIHFERLQTIIQDVKSNFKNMVRLSRTYCEIMFSDPRVLNIRDKKFDLVINAVFGSDCDAGFAWKSQAPLISILNARHTPWALHRMGNPSNPAYMPVIHSRFPVKMNFFQRMINTGWHLYFLYMYFYYGNGEDANKMARKFFGNDMPDINEMVFNTSLLFVNTHFSVDMPYPLVPNCIEIGGIHVKEPQPLPLEIQKFMDEAEHGVIFFTLGSMVRTSTFPNQTIQAFKEAFAELPQRVLWKFENENEDMPSNVLIRKWFPQNDIFGHKNIKAFISHGGNSGALEAVHFGVPIIGIPLFYDQYRNILSFVKEGVAVLLDVNDLTKDNILSSVRTVVNDKSYSERMKALSQLFRDRPMSPLDTAVYWTEYVIRDRKSVV